MARKFFAALAIAFSGYCVAELDASNVFTVVDRPDRKAGSVPG